MEFMQWLDEFILLHTLKNNPTNAKTEALKHIRDALKIIPTNFYLDQNNWNLDTLKTTLLTFLEGKPEIRNDMELQFLKNEVFEFYRMYLEEESARMRVRREV